MAFPRDDFLIRISVWRKWISQSATSNHIKMQNAKLIISLVLLSAFIYLFFLHHFSINAIPSTASPSILAFFFVDYTQCVCYFNDIVHFAANKKTEFNAFHEMEVKENKPERKCIMPSTFYVFWFCIRDDFFFFAFTFERICNGKKKKKCLPSEKKNNSEIHHLCRWCCWMLAAVVSLILIWLDGTSVRIKLNRWNVFICCLFIIIIIFFMTEFLLLFFCMPALSLSRSIERL